MRTRDTVDFKFQIYKILGAGIYIDRVMITDTMFDRRQYVFYCNKWLDSGQVDGKMERMLTCAGTVAFYNNLHRTLNISN